MNAWVLARREWRSAFETPVAYVFLALFPALASLFFFVLSDFFAEGRASLRGFFAVMPGLLVLAAPAATMRMWSEERRAGTEELLLSYPFRVSELVLGKYLAALGLLVAALALTAGAPLTVAALGELDWGPVVAGYAGTLLLGSASLAIGLFFSACTRNQIVAWLLAAAALFLANTIGVAATASAIPPALGRLFLGLDFGVRFQSVARGVLGSADVLYYLAVTAWFLSLNGLLVERKRWQ